jgi:murein DD-endopeptidase MepM/ murein hydrolase activator NlpD
MDPRFLLGAAALGFAAIAGRKKSGGGGGGSFQKRSQHATLLNPMDALKAIGIPQDDWPNMSFEIPFAAGASNPLWPVVTNHSKKFTVCYKKITGKYEGNSSRRFMSSRSGGSRYHAGIDLYGNPDDPIIAMESGVIVNYYHFYHGTYALFVQCDSGLVINYGEVKNKSWSEFGLSTGSRVQRGQPIARVGQMSGGSHMCHFETYMPPTEKNQKYHGGDPNTLLNPTYYLLLARAVSGGGRAYAGIDCIAAASMNHPIPPDLQHIAVEDERVGDSGGDSVLPELLTEDDYRPEKDRADGP